MSFRARRITKALQTYDYELYAKQDNEVIRVYRKCKELRIEHIDVNTPMLNMVRNDHLVMSLTDTWGTRGKPVDWGIEPIMARIKALDLWNSDNLSSKFFTDEEKEEESKMRDFRNSTESFLYDFKSQFARATNDVNTSSLSKFDKRRNGDKKLWQS